LSDRRAEFDSQQHRKSVGRRARQIEAVGFFNVLTGPELLEQTEVHLPEHRERLYPPTVTLAMFMKQSLNEDRSCQKAVNGWAAQRVAEGLSANSVDTAAYCRARQRLPVEMVMALTRETGRLLSERAPQGWRWRGRTVKLVDGSTISMPDTAANQSCYPQPCSQAAGVGFPLARILAVICLSSGAVLQAAIGPYQGPGNSELGLLRSLGEIFCAGDVMLADALFCNYFLIAALQAAGVEMVFAQQGGRITDFRRGERLGARDHKVHWAKPRRPQWMSPEQYQSFPPTLMLREVQVDGHVLVTTMLDQRQVSKSELAELYAQRWQVELDLRNIKTTLGMQVLRCRTPSMVVKEMWVHLLAYNLIRLLMVQAARAACVHPRELSFKHTVQMWTEWTARRLSSAARHTADLLRLIAQIKVGDRPGRIEPRMRKRRPKPYPSLKVPRAQARSQIPAYAHA
jgi:hypothetical protein